MPHSDFLAKLISVTLIVLILPQQYHIKCLVWWSTVVPISCFWFLLLFASPLLGGGSWLSYSYIKHQQDYSGLCSSISIIHSMTPPPLQTWFSVWLLTIFDSVSPCLTIWLWLTLFYPVLLCLTCLDSNWFYLIMFELDWLCLALFWLCNLFASYC